MVTADVSSCLHNNGKEKIYPLFRKSALFPQPNLYVT